MVSEIQLSDVLSEFARTMVTDFPLQAILDRLVGRIVDVLPISDAGVTLISSDARPHLVAASSESALRFENLQTELGEGPCVASYTTGEAIIVEDLKEETRFPKFVARAIAEGLAGVFTFPLRHGDVPLGALDLYATHLGALDAAALSAAQTLADVVAAYLLNAQTRLHLVEMSSQLLEQSVRSHEASRRDDLTGLANRVLFMERLGEALVRVARSGKVVAVLFVDLDRFKAVNDVHGHRVGDQLLVAVAKRITGALRPGDTLARLSGDEFVILCEELDPGTDVLSIVRSIAARVGDKLGVPFVLSGIEVDMTASVGIALSDQHDLVSEQLLHHADTAMYRAKRNGGDRQEILERSEQQLVDRQADLTYDLSKAISRDEFQLVYQPIVAVDHHIFGVEALLRWTHPSSGLVSPTTFIPLAEKAGLMNGVGRWVFEQACRGKSQWENEHPNAMGLSLNVSVHQLLTPGFAGMVASVLTDTATNPEGVTLEVTESVFMEDGDDALGVLSDLKDLGVALALDDFGTGYSSLGHLRRFPIDVVKIDQSFVADLRVNPSSHAIVSALVDLSHTLGMTVVAEGVETAEQCAELGALGCDRYQGFHFARPMGVRDLQGFIHQHQH